MGARQEYYKDGKLIKVIDNRTLKEEKETALKNLRKEAYEVLSKTDWYVTRLTERGVEIPKDVLLERKRIFDHIKISKKMILGANNMKAVDLFNYLNFFNGLKEKYNI